MNREMARRFLERIYSTKDDELDCAGLIEVIDRYVELDVHGEEAADFASDVPHHLQMCRDCAELVATLTEMVRLEECGELPQVDELWRELDSAVEPGRSTSTSSTGSETPHPESGGKSAMQRLREWIMGPRVVLIWPVLGVAGLVLRAVIR